MAIAAAITLPLTTPTRRSLSSLSANPNRISSPFTLQSNKLKFAAIQCPSFRISAVSSMKIEVPENSSSASFLDRKESDFVHFVKYHGLGNDFILVDNRDTTEPKVSPDQAVKLCDRNFGIGADGVIFAMPGVNGTDYTMRIFNSDGNISVTYIEYPCISANHAVGSVSPCALEKYIDAYDFLQYFYFCNFNLSWKPYTAVASSHGDSSFTVLGLLEQLNTTGELPVYLWYKSNVEINLTAGVLQSGNWPGLIVFSAEQVLHIFVKKQCARTVFGHLGNPKLSCSDDMNQGAGVTMNSDISFVHVVLNDGPQSEKWNSSIFRPAPPADLNQFLHLSSVRRCKHHNNTIIDALGNTSAAREVGQKAPTIEDIDKIIIAISKQMESMKMLQEAIFSHICAAADFVESELQATNIALKIMLAGYCLKISPNEFYEMLGKAGGASIGLKMWSCSQHKIKCLLDAFEIGKRYVVLVISLEESPHNECKLLEVDFVLGAGRIWFKLVEKVAVPLSAF
ncbi:hypothetical protein MTR67_038267 [Solanum verrucosum]|uniref:Diaminopimelate epimerase n=1 Tax=Solanum verrucosum TaxID=315347 RepID=A0AAF0ZMM9_SOLVR|nr:hypothetical protein MTR67_038267 [Solanum verrucosum]